MNEIAKRLQTGAAPPRLTRQSRAGVGPIAAKVWPGTLYFAVLAAFWELMARKLHSPLVPDVAAIYGQLAEIVGNGSAFVQIWITFARMGLGFLLALVIAMPVGIVAARSKSAARFIEPGVTLGLTVPGLVWALLCVIWFGTSLLSPVISVALGVLPSLVITVKEGIQSLSVDLIEMTRVFRLSRRAVLRKIWLPVLYAFIVPGTRIGFSIAWKVIVLVEIFGMSDGVGYQLNTQFSTQNVEGVIAWTVAFWAAMLVFENLIFAPIERHANRWKKREVQ